MAIAEDGLTCSPGATNETGQLGHGDLNNRATPTVVEALADHRVVAGSCGKGHTVVITDADIAFAWGANKHGQLGVEKRYRQDQTQGGRRPHASGAVRRHHRRHRGELRRGVHRVDLRRGRRRVHRGPSGISRPARSRHRSRVQHRRVLREIGVYDPQPMPARVAALSGARVTKIACGHNHTVCVDAAGEKSGRGFGGYGRLGHKVQKDEWTPKMVEIQGGDRTCAPKIAWWAPRRRARGSPR